MGERAIPAGEALLLLAAAVSIQMAQGRTVDQLELIAAFFEVLGDNLSLIAARRSMTGGSEQGETEKPGAGPLDS